MGRASGVFAICEAAFGVAVAAPGSESGAAGSGFFFGR